MPDDKPQTELLDELEKGPWPSFVKEIKSAGQTSASAQDLLRQLELSYQEKKGHWRHGGLVGMLGYGDASEAILGQWIAQLSGFDAGREAIQKLAVIVTYALAINIFHILAEVFTAFYSEIPAHEEHFKYLFIGLNGDRRLVPWMWLSVLLSWVALTLLLVPKWRTNIRLLVVACACVFVSIWLDKGLGLIVGGLAPSPLGAVTRYVPTLPESTIVLGIWASGALMITVFYKITLSVWEDN